MKASKEMKQAVDTARTWADQLSKNDAGFLITLPATDVINVCQALLEFTDAKEKRAKEFKDFMRDNLK